MKIVFATNNNHKLDEIRKILGEEYEVLSLNDIGCHEDIPENCDTLEGNSQQKAEYVFNHYGYDCFADDTGLEVDALGGEPGVHSARYAEETDHDSEANMQKLLHKLGENNNRKARFRTVITLLRKSLPPAPSHQRGSEAQPLPNGEAKPTQRTECHVFEGIVEGHIAYEKKGTEGFGYDPIFVPDGYEQSFAELGNEIKNTISHRARALQALKQIL